MSGKLKTLLFGPRELAQVPVTLVETSGVMATRFSGAPGDGVLTAADDGGLTFAYAAPAARLEFTSHGSVSFTIAESSPDAAVVGPYESAEFRGRVGWIGEDRDTLTSSIEIVLANTASDDRAVFRVRDTRGWTGVISEGSYGKDDMIWDIFAFARAVARARAGVGLPPLLFHGVLNETSWRYRYC